VDPDPGYGAFLTQDLGWGKIRTLDTGSAINTHDHLFKSLVTRLKMLKMFVADFKSDVFLTMDP
jgi:hypothetical protein